MPLRKWYFFCRWEICEINPRYVHRFTWFFWVRYLLCLTIDKDSTDKSFLDTFEGFENIEHEPESDTLRYLMGSIQKFKLQPTTIKWTALPLGVLSSRWVSDGICQTASEDYSNELLMKNSYESQCCYSLSSNSYLKCAEHNCDICNQHSRCSDDVGQHFSAARVRVQ